MIDYNAAENALRFLGRTDEEAARARAHYMALEDLKKTMLAAQYEKQEGSAADKNQAALNSIEYSQHLEKINNAFVEWEILRNKRKSAELQIEMWRSVNSNQRKGNI